MRERSSSIDILKSISIFGVVFIHGASSLGCESHFSIIISEIFRFAVPCFIVVWSYFIEKSLLHKTKEQQSQYLKKRFLHLFTVFLLWGLLYFSYFVDFNFANLSLSKIITTNFSGYGWAGQYFFIVLFQFVLLFPLLRFLYSSKAIRITVYVLSIGFFIISAYSNLHGLIHQLGYRPFVYWVPYVFLGVALARGWSVQIAPWWLCSILLIPIEFSLHKTLGITNEFHNYVLPSIMLSSILISIYAIQYSAKIDSNLISYIGKNTMIIFVSNPLVIKVINLAPIVPIIDCGWLGNIILPISTTALIVAVSLLINRLLTVLKLKNILS